MTWIGTIQPLPLIFGNFSDERCVHVRFQELNPFRRTDLRVAQRHPTAAAAAAAVGCSSGGGCGSSSGGVAAVAAAAAADLTEGLGSLTLKQQYGSDFNTNSPRRPVGRGHLVQQVLSD
jgi:hypothetical protein